MKTLIQLTYNLPKVAKRLLAQVCLLACLLAANAEAAISVGPSGTTGTLTFDTLPTVADGWSTMTVAGGGGDVTDAAGLDAAVQGLAASSFTTALGNSPTLPISANAIARWHETLHALMTPPTGVKCTVLLATLQNNTGAEQSMLTMSYDLGDNLAAGTTVQEEVPGHRVYYSLTGEAGSWQVIAGISSDGNPGSKVGTLNLGSWTSGSLLYILWADDNGSADRNNANSEEGGYTIDNFVASVGSVESPAITQQPVSITVTQGFNFQLTVAASGLGVQYQWYRGGVAIDPASNPTATQPALVVTNASLSDDNLYQVTASNSGGTATSTEVHVTVIADTIPPVLVSANEDPVNTQLFYLRVNEPLCVDGNSCGSSAADAANWAILSLDESEELGVASVTVNGTNLTLQAGFPRDPAKVYKIVVSPAGSGIADRFGNFKTIGDFIEVAHAVAFLQNVNGYAGTQDTELRGAAPDVAQGSAVGITVDLDDGGGISHGLLRFSNLFGSDPGQIPVGAEIVSATLMMQHTVANANGNPVQLHRMLVDWDPTTATYNSFGAGVQPNGIESATNIDAIVDSTGKTVPFSLTVDVTPSLIDWANGQPNYGWAFIPTGTDGYRFDTSESTTPPTLSVAYRIVPCSSVVITKQPVAQTVLNEGDPLTLDVGVTSPGCPASYQWNKDGVNIPGANGPVLHIEHVVASDSGNYDLFAFNDAPSGVQSVTAHVVVNADNVRPVLLRTASPNDTTLVLTFSKPLAAASAGNAGNYTITPGITVTSAVLSNGVNNATVTLTSSARTFPGRYTLRISNVTDARPSLNPLNPNPTDVVLTSATTFQPWAAVWKYDTNSQDATLTSGTPWYAPAFNDSAWATGSGLFGLETSAGTIPLLPAPIATALPVNTNQFAYYFRTTMNVPSIPAGTEYMLCHFVDDGAIFYVDGVEVSRFNMTNTAPVLFGDFASATPAGGDGSTVCVPVSLPAGSHTLAVELHQANATSSDVVFGAELRAVTLPATVSIANGPTAGQATVNWKADSSWELVTSDNVLGPYTPVTNSALGSFTIGNVGATNQAFFHLRYRDNR